VFRSGNATVDNLGRVSFLDNLFNLDRFNNSGNVFNSDNLSSSIGNSVTFFKSVNISENQLEHSRDVAVGNVGTLFNLEDSYENSCSEMKLDIIDLTGPAFSEVEETLNKQKMMRQSLRS
jgi:hypothetical protein